MLNLTLTNKRTELWKRHTVRHPFTRLLPDKLDQLFFTSFIISPIENVEIFAVLITAPSRNVGRNVDGTIEFS
jgi:hypothetical protein